MGLKWGRRCLERSEYKSIFIWFVFFLGLFYCLDRRRVLNRGYLFKYFVILDFKFLLVVFCFRYEYFC